MKYKDQIKLWAGVAFVMAGTCALAFDNQLDVTEIKTDEGYTYNYTGSEVSPTVPTGYNNITQYTYTVTSAGGAVETHTVNVGDDYQSLSANASSSHQVIQPSDPSTTVGKGGYATPLEDSDSAYLNAGDNGLSLSTGINKTPKFDRDTYTFDIHGFDASIVGDGYVDFFAADIAKNQSSEEISIWSGDDLLAYVIIDESDWNTEIGWQVVDRIDIDGTVNSEDFVAPISVIAIELCDFTLADGYDWDYVAEYSTMLEIDIPALGDDDQITEENPPKTDYAFLFAVDTTQIIATPQAVPEPASVTLMALIAGVGLFIRRLTSV